MSKSIAEQILDELKMLNATIQKLDATLSKPRPTHKSLRAEASLRAAMTTYRGYLGPR